MCNSCQSELPDVAEALAEALETMAFVTVLPPEDDQTPVDPVIVSLEFTGSIIGVARLVAPLAFGRMLAGNVLGSDESDPEAIARTQDVLKELLNITCGRMLRSLPQASAVEMELPTIAPFDSEHWPSLCAQPGVTLLDADGHRIAIVVTLGRSQPIRQEQTCLF